MSLIKTLAELPREKLASESGNGGVSGEVFKVVHEGKPYKLRACKNERVIQMLKDYIPKIEHLGILPKFYGHEDNIFVFEYVEGRDLKRDEPIEVFKELGRIMATVDKLPSEAIPLERIDLEFFLSIDYLLRINQLSSKQGETLAGMYHELKPKSLECSMGYFDAWPHNFKQTEKGILIVDEEGFQKYAKGLGAVKPFNYWFNEEQRAAYIEGYEKIGSLKSFLDNEKFFTILMLSKYNKNRHMRGTAPRLGPLIKIAEGKWK